MNGYQQGDVILIRRETMPEGKSVAPKAGVLVLAEGEHTGHAHTLAAEFGELVEDANGVLWLKVEQETEVTHQEHAAQTVAPGIYEVRRVVEVDPFQDEVRTVMD